MKKAAIVERYVFRSVTRLDLPMLGDWLRTPAAVRWWGNPGEQLALLHEDLDEPRMTMIIVACDGVPFAYAQHYEVHAWPQPHLAHLPAGSRAIDAFIGVPAMLGRGHGSAVLRLQARHLRGDGAPVVVIDPAADNHRARRAYAKAGFRGDAIVETAAGPAVMMLFTD